MKGKKTVLITGATSGIGLAFAKYFASKKFDLILTGRNKVVLKQNSINLKKQFNVNTKIIISDFSKDYNKVIQEIKKVNPQF